MPPTVSRRPRRQIEEDQAAGRMPKRKVLPADYLRRRALWLPETARYDWIMQQAAVERQRPAQAGHRGHDRHRGRISSRFKASCPKTTASSSPRCSKT